MYDCDKLKLGNGLIKADYGIQYSEIKSFVEDNKCAIQCTLQEMTDCPVLNSIYKYKDNEQRKKEQALLKKKFSNKFNTNK